MAVKRKITVVEIPILNTKVELFGEAEKLEGRTIKLDLTRMLRGKSMEGTFVIAKGIAQPKKFVLLSFYIRRMIRKRISYIEDSFICESADGKLKIKPFFITRKRVHRSVRKALREKAKAEIIEYCKEKNSEQIFEALLAGMFQKELAIKLKKIYPLSLCEIRVIEKVK